MPIREVNKSRYPKNWKEISHRIRFERAQGRCEVCGVENYAIGGRDRGRFFKALPVDGKIPEPGQWAMCEQDFELWLIRIVLTVAHLDHTPENCDDSNLKAMCQQCHNRYDAPHRWAGIKARQKERENEATQSLAIDGMEKTG